MSTTSIEDSPSSSKGGSLGGTTGQTESNQETASKQYSFSITSVNIKRQHLVGCWEAR
jgi:hypothetical protein